MGYKGVGGGYVADRRFQFYLNGVGYKDGWIHQHVAIGRRFYLNGVGYKVGIAVESGIVLGWFYLNGVGYKDAPVAVGVEREKGFI